MNHSTRQTVWYQLGDHPRVWEDYASDCGGDTPNGVYYLGTTSNYIEVLPGDIIHDMDDGTALVAGPMTKRRGYGRRPWYNTVTNTTDTEPDMNSMSTMKRSDVAPQSIAATPEHTIPQQVDSLNRDIDNLSVDLYTLEGRLETVMTPTYAEASAKPMREDADGPDTGPNSALATALETFGSQVRSIRRRVNEIVSRLEV